MDSTTLQSEYSCARCDVHCPTKSHLIKHMTLIHRSLQQTTQGTKFNYECPTCGKEFATLSHLNQHLSVHQRPQFNCSKCPKALRTRVGLRSHSRVHHGIDVTKGPTNCKCDECGGLFKNLKSFAQHAAIHKPPQFPCNECDRKFFTWTGMLVHTKSLHRGVSCERCPQKFATAGSLKMHLKRAHQPKEHKCPHCYREFWLLSLLNSHLLKSHSISVEKRLDECEICQKVCKSESGLAAHMIFHGKPRLSCGQCNRMFHGQATLSFHIRRIHTVRFAMPANTNSKEINYTCAVCCRPFGSITQPLVRLLRHLKTHYFEPQMCLVCQKMFTSDRTYREHIGQDHPDTREPFGCGFCSKSFLSKKTHQIHIKHHQKPTMACPNCPLLFYNKSSLRCHSKSHNSETKSTPKGKSKLSNTFACAICLRQFPVRGRVRDHLINTHSPTTFGCSKCDFQCYMRVALIRHLRYFHAQ